MLTKELIKEIITEQNSKIRTKNTGIKRLVLDNIEKKLQIPHILVISGIRRCGKSTLLTQIMKQFYSQTPFYYINFDDERWLGFDATHFNTIYECLVELFGRATTFFIDEIQNIKRFESFVRRFYDDGFKFIITGSNSDMLSSEIASKLTGRYVEIPLYPFDFKEYLNLKNVEFNDSSQYDTLQRVIIRTQFEKYLFAGGMPEYAVYNDTDILKQVYENIITKDIALRFHISKVYEMRELYQYLITNFSRKFSYTSLAKNVSLESKITVKEFISYFEIAFLGKQIYKFDNSLKKRLANDKKLYLIDNAFIPLISTALTKDLGRLLENLAFNVLSKQNEVLYFFDKNECDFITTNNRQITGIYQVCYELNNENRKRELAGLTQAMTTLNAKNGKIITFDQDEVISENGFEILVIPFWKWLLFSN